MNLNFHLHIWWTRCQMFGISNDMREPMTFDEPVISETCYITSHWLLFFFLFFYIKPGGMCCDVIASEHDYKRELQQKGRFSLFHCVFLAQSYHVALEDKRKWHISCMGWFLWYFYGAFLVDSPSCLYGNKLSEYSTVYIYWFSSIIFLYCPLLSCKTSQSWTCQNPDLGSRQIFYTNINWPFPLDGLHSYMLPELGEWFPGLRWHGVSQRRAAGLIVFSCSPVFTWPCFGRFPSILLNLI